MKVVAYSLAGLCVVGLASGCAKGRTSTWERTAPVAAQSSEGGEKAEAAGLGDSLWEQRADKEKLVAAIAAWDAELSSSPENLDLLVKLARGTYFLADAYLRDDAAAYLDTFQRGVDYAERALVVSSPEFKERVSKGEQVKDAVQVVGSEGVAALYWYSSNLGKWAKAKGFTTTLGNKDTIKAVMERCLALDENFFFGGPHRYFGAFYSVAPSFAGGDLQKSKTHFEKSIELAPEYVATKVLMAENFAVKSQDRALYVKLLEEVLATPDDVIEGLQAETMSEKSKAREMLAQVDELF